jgi:hypothetical protein
MPSGESPIFPVSIFFIFAMLTAALAWFTHDIRRTSSSAMPETGITSSVSDVSGSDALLADYLPSASLKIPEKFSLEYPAAYVQKSPSSGCFYAFFSVLFHRIARYDRLTYETPSKGRVCDDLDAELLRGFKRPMVSSSTAKVKSIQPGLPR